MNKLITLSGLIDEATTENDPIFRNDDEAVFDRIVKYNNFLKQPLTKDMFVNQFESQFEENKGVFSFMEAYQEAEKKVIFDGWSIDRKGNFISSDHIMGSITLEISCNDYWSIVEYGTIEEFAQASKDSCIKLKNVEL